MDKRNIIFTTFDCMEAGLVKSLLEANAVHVFMVDENMSSLNHFYISAIGGIKLVVSDDQVSLAQEVLREYREKAGQDPNCGSSSSFSMNISHQSTDQ